MKPSRSMVPIVIGQVFGDLTVTGRADSRCGARFVSCKCTCGNELERLFANLYRGYAAGHCGCKGRLGTGKKKPKADPDRALPVRKGPHLEDLLAKWTREARYGETFAAYKRRVG